MRTATEDILSPAVLEYADAVCFTSNGVVKADSRLVMGAGNALAFKNRFLGIDECFGHLVKSQGNHVYWIERCSLNENQNTALISFPTKNHWRDPSDLELIERSARELMQVLKHNSHWNDVYLPAPGIGRGGLHWQKVRPVLEPILDDRVVIAFKP
jgi:hypothetical protein